MMAPNRPGDGMGGRGPPPFDNNERRLNEFIQILEEQIRSESNSDPLISDDLIQQLTSALDALKNSKGK